MKAAAQPNSTLATSPDPRLGDDSAAYSEITRTRDLSRLAPMSVVVVDAPCFTLSYDFSLCEALVKNQCKVTLARSAYSYATWCASGSFELWEGFYPIAGKLSKIFLPASCKRLLKTAEHVFDMRRFVARMCDLKPDVIHFQWLPVPALDKIYLRQLQRIAPLVLTAHNTTLYHGASSKLQGVGISFYFRILRRDRCPYRIQQEQNPRQGLDFSGSRRRDSSRSSRLLPVAWRHGCR